MAALLHAPSLGFASFPGKTVNMSRSGVLLEFEGVIPGLRTGTFVCAEIELRTGEGEPDRCIECSGEVVRIEAAGSLQRIALSLTRIRFRDRSRTLLSQADSAMKVM